MGACVCLTGLGWMCRRRRHPAHHPTDLRQPAEAPSQLRRVAVSADRGRPRSLPRPSPQPELSPVMSFLIYLLFTNRHIAAGGLSSSQAPSTSPLPRWCSSPPRCAHRCPRHDAPRWLRHAAVIGLPFWLQALKAGSTAAASDQPRIEILNPP